MPNYNVDLPDNLITPLFNNEKAASGGFTHKITLPFSLVKDSRANAVADTLTVRLGDSMPNFIVDKIAAFVEVPFSPAGTLNIEVGTDGDIDGFLDSVSVITAGPKTTEKGIIPESSAAAHSAGADKIDIRFTHAGTGLISTLTAGLMYVWLGIRSADKGMA